MPLEPSAEAASAGACRVGTTMRWAWAGKSHCCEEFWSIHTRTAARLAVRLYQGERSRKIASEPFNVFARATARLLQAFLKALQEQSAPPCHARDNRASLALMLAAYESHRRGVPVELSHE
ncbi:MAG: hypothetical protein V3T83_10580 [Acidobacteriota bacterium]